MTSTSDLAVRPLHLLTEEEPGGVDLPAAERAAHDLLLALGADLSDESLADTPARVARMYAELLTPSPFTATTFPNDGGYDQLVVARDIPFHSLCEHHLLPFIGVAHVAYLPGQRIVGLSKLARVVESFARSAAGPGAADHAGRRLAAARARAARASASCSRPSTCACPCAASRSPARPR